MNSVIVDIRVASLREELSSEMGELPAARPETRKFRRR